MEHEKKKERKKERQKEKRKRDRLISRNSEKITPSQKNQKHSREKMTDI